jgi:spore germination protein GerM
MKKPIIIILILAIAIATFFFVNRDKNSWVCEEGEWVKQGEPTNPIPDEECTISGDSLNLDDQSSNGLENDTTELLEVVDENDTTPTTDETINIQSTSNQTMEVTIFFSNSIFNPLSDNCEWMFPVKRTVPKTQASARATLNELIKGTNSKESKSGYHTSISPHTKIQSLIIENGIAKVDFSKDLNSSGSCRVLAIRSQILESLLQFPSINNVVISIDGETETILQP